MRGGGGGGRSSCLAAVVLVLAVLIGLPLALRWGSQQWSPGETAPPAEIDASYWSGNYPCDSGDLWLVLALHTGRSGTPGQERALASFTFFDREGGDHVAEAPHTALSGWIEDGRLRLSITEDSEVTSWTPRAFDAVVTEDSLVGEVVADGCGEVWLTPHQR